MRIFIDDGSTAIKMQWQDESGKVHQHISPNAFKREWSAPNGSTPVYNFTINGEDYSNDPSRHDVVVTTNVRYQYNDVNVVAIHQALLSSGIAPQEIDVTVSLPISEFFDSRNQPNTANIEKKRANVLKPLSVAGIEPFVIRSVEVMPESIPAGYSVLSELEPHESLLIVDLGGTTLDISQVRGKGQGISKIHGDSTIGVSIVTNAVKDALTVAKSPLSATEIDDLIKRRDDHKYLASRLTKPEELPRLVAALEDGQKRLINRVLEVLDGFGGYSHALVIGGGAELIGAAVKQYCDLPADRFFKTKTSQYDLVAGMYQIGQ